MIPLELDTGTEIIGSLFLFRFVREETRIRLRRYGLYFPSLSDLAMLLGGRDDSGSGIDESDSNRRVADHATSMVLTLTNYNTRVL
jgi:hypothetical protein